MARTSVYAPLSCGKVATVMRCTLPDLVHLKRLEEKMVEMTVEDILLGDAIEFNTLFESCVRLPAEIDRLELDSEDVCEIADKFREVNKRFLSRLQRLNVIMTLGKVENEEDGKMEDAAVDLLLGTLKGQLHNAMQ
jgi:hypothetical protein